MAALVSVSALAKESSPGAASPALDLARQLNQAFIEVADSVSKSVVVIKVKTKEDREGGGLRVTRSTNNCRRSNASNSSGSLRNSAASSLPAANGPSPKPTIWRGIPSTTDVGPEW